MCRALFARRSRSFFGWSYVPTREKDFFFCNQSFPLGGENHMPSNAILEKKQKAVADLAEQIKTERGKVVVDDTMKTSVDNIYACGDINGRIMLAHTAFKMGEVAAENCMTGENKKCDLRFVPSCLYTSPEAASVGLTEEKARELHPEGIRVGKFQMSANGRSLASGEKAGFIKVIADNKYGQILGVHMVGGVASEMIAEPTTLMAMEITINEVADDIIHAHPSYSEAFMEACADALGRCIHLPAKKK